MSQVRNTTIQQNFPAIRRRSLTNITTLIKNTTSFFTHLADQSNKHSKPSLKESEDAIASHFNRIHFIIDTIDDHITRRLENHQNEVFSLVKLEIEEMREQTRRIVQKLNEAIALKNTEDQIWNLNNQLDYFKSQTYQLFKQNKKSKQEFSLLKKQLREMEVELENSDLVMQKLKKQYLKEHMIKDKLVSLLKEKISNQSIQHLNIQQIDHILKLQKIRPSTKMKTQPTQSKQSQFFQSRVQVNLGSNELQQQSKVIIHLNNHSLHTQSNKFPAPQNKLKSPSILSSLNEQSQSQLPELPPPRLIKVQSQLQIMPQMLSFKMPKKVQKGIQTQSINDKQQPPKATPRQAAVKMFSNTSYVQLQKKQKEKKKFDLTKNGFFVRSYNQKIDKLGTKTESVSSVVLKKEMRHMRYLSNAMNKSKMITSQAEVRGNTNKTALK